MEREIKRQGVWAVDQEKKKSKCIVNLFPVKQNILLVLVQVSPSPGFPILRVWDTQEAFIQHAPIYWYNSCGAYKNHDTHRFHVISPSRCKFAVKVKLFHFNLIQSTHYTSQPHPGAQETSWLNCVYSILWLSIYALGFWKVSGATILLL